MVFHFLGISHLWLYDISTEQISYSLKLLVMAVAMMIHQKVVVRSKIIIMVCVVKETMPPRQIMAVTRKTSFLEVI